MTFISTPLILSSVHSQLSEFGLIGIFYTHFAFGQVLTAPSAAPDAISRLELFTLPKVTAALEMAEA